MHTGHLLFSKDSICCQLNTTVSSKEPLWFISFFTMVITPILVFLCLFIVVDMMQDNSYEIKSSQRLLNSTHLYKNPKNTSVTVLLVMISQFGMIYVMRFVLSSLLPVSGKKLKSYLFKNSFPLKCINYLASPWYRPGFVYGVMII